MRRDYGALGVQFDLWKGEADVHDLIQPMMDDLKARGIAEESEGALVVRVAEPDDKKEMPPLILVEVGRRGDVRHDRPRHHRRPRALARSRLILYVVDQRQHLHFEQVFRAARRAGLTGRRRWSISASAP